jgi:GTP cyclohydrolase III
MAKNDVIDILGAALNELTPQEQRKLKAELKNTLPFMVELAIYRATKPEEANENVKPETKSAKKKRSPGG